MKNLLNNTIACAIVMTACFSCSVESIENEQLETSNVIEDSITQDALCTAQNPQARLTNNGTIPVTLRIATIDGTILHTVQDLAPGNSSSFLMFAEGDIIFSVEKNTTGLGDEKVVYAMGQCMSFDIEVDIDNYLTTAVPQNL